jgi:hypothetical protein
MTDEEYEAMRALDRKVDGLLYGPMAKRGARSRRAWRDALADHLLGDVPRSPRAAIARARARGNFVMGW